MTPTEAINTLYPDDLEIKILTLATKGVKMLAPQKDRSNTIHTTLL
jgi:hypothetical protein